MPTVIDSLKEGHDVSPIIDKKKDQIFQDEIGRWSDFGTNSGMDNTKEGLTNAELANTIDIFFQVERLPLNI